MVRRHAPSAVDPEVIERIAAAAFRAPSAGNTRGLAVVTITRSENIAAVAAAAGEAGYVAKGFDPWVSSAAGIIVIGVSPSAYQARYAEPDKHHSAQDWTIPYWWVDAGAALMAVLLSAVDQGLGAGFLGAHAIPGLAEVVGFPHEIEPLGIVTVGHPAPHRRSSSLDRPQPSPPIHSERWNGV